MMRASHSSSPGRTRGKAVALLAKATCFLGFMLVAACWKPSPILISTRDGHVRLCRSPATVTAVQIWDSNASESLWRDLPDPTATASVLFELLVSSKVDQRPLHPGQIFRDEAPIRLVLADGSKAEMSVLIGSDRIPRVAYDDDTGDLRSDNLRLENDALVTYIRTLTLR